MISIPIATVLCIPSIPQIFKSMSAVFLAPLVASMSCRVYRNIKVFEYDVLSSYSISEIQFV